MSTDPATPTPTPAVNADQVTPNVIRPLLVAGVAYLLAAWGIDTKWSGPVTDAILPVGGVLIAAIGAWWGSRTAKQRVTPTSRYGTPTDHDGVPLVRAAHDPTTGYPKPRVDRRGYDRDADY